MMCDWPIFISLVAEYLINIHLSKYLGVYHISLKKDRPSAGSSHTGWGLGKGL
uniref:Uncharacterized protein n=1 Tax=Arundo donax TaxID=35708 RepID=A0A0A9FRW0_ARUDO